MTQTAKLDATIMTAGQANAEVVYNDMTIKLEWAAGPNIEEADVLNPSALSPTAGEAWLIVGTGAGVWASHDNEIAINNDGTVTGWTFVTPWAGLRLWNKETSATVLYDGANWITDSGALFELGLTADMAALTSGTGDIDWDQEYYKDGGATYWTHSTSTNEEQITFNKSGKYRVRLEIRSREAATNNGVQDHWMEIDPLGVGSFAEVVNSRQRIITRHSVSAQSLTCGSEQIVDINATDIMRYRKTQTGGGVHLITEQETKLTIQKIG